MELGGYIPYRRGDHLIIEDVKLISWRHRLIPVFANGAAGMTGGIMD
jgi:hypothetical protein